MTVEYCTFPCQELSELRLINGIKWAFVDLDGTLVDTNLLFRRKMTGFASHLSKLSKGTIKDNEVFECMGKILNGLRGTYNVNSTLMTEVARLTTTRLGLSFFDEETISEFDKLMRIYTTVPPDFDGAVQSLKTLKDSGFKIAIFTNSTYKWAVEKAAKHDFPHDLLLTVPSHIKKDSQQWSLNINFATKDIKTVLAIGDSWTNDIESALKAGVPIDNLIRVKTGYDDANKNRIAGVQEVNSFSNIPELLLEKWRMMRRFQ
jgi:FMN phosphatase YigB (HAD superfamily)